MNQTLINNLQQPHCYSHPITHFQLMETHLSWVILTGAYAYKIKKPVNFGFADFSTLEKRRFYCEQECHLNQRFAASLYIGVVPIYGSIQQPSLKEEGPIIEYALKMHAYSQSCLMTAHLNNNTVTIPMVEALAEAIAGFHRIAEPIEPHSSFGSPALVYEPIQGNFDAIRPLLSDVEDFNRLQACETWAAEQYQRHLPLLQHRYETQRIRACHGDLHCGNIAFIEGKPTLLDCIEFNESFRWTDPMGDVGFLAMDLRDKGHNELANIFINHYFQITGDYEALPLLRFYEAYRAMVRAKICLLRLTQHPISQEEQRITLQHYHQRIALAADYKKTTQPTLYISHGLSASGKSTVARYLVNHQVGLQLQSDRERKRLLKANIQPSEATKKILYSENHTQKTYDYLKNIADTLLQSGYSVIIDACCLQQWQRQLFIAVAKKNNVAYQLIHCIAPKAILEARLTHRQQNSNELSDADIAVLALQIKNEEPLSEEEKKHTIVFNCRTVDITSEDITTLLQPLSLLK
ncbi:MAG: bifunctional aminoglycoside phosphotransferase/ATP-binding protein [Gammaproteobacteria bacterium]